jgi:hypothetical protein
MSDVDPARRDDPAEAGALEDEPDVPGEDRPPAQDEPAESGALEDAAAA